MTQEKLPRELVEEILCRVLPLSLTRFRTVCKQWNALYNDKTFITHHLALARPQFLLYSNSKIYSVCVNLNDDPTIEMRDLPLHIPYSKNYMPIHITSCEGLLFCTSWSWNGAAVWNPWLRQTRWIEEENLKFYSMGYDGGRPEKGLKILGLSLGQAKLNDIKCQLYEFKTNTWKSINASPEVEPSIQNYYNYVSLNGTLYWRAYNFDTHEYHVQSFDFSKEIFKTVCVLPWKHDSSFDSPVFSAFRGDHLSVLRKFIRTNTVEVWVTKSKINNKEENVEWMNFMTVSIPGCRGYCPSYFIDHFYKNSLIMCWSDENKKDCIYIVKGNVFKKIELDPKVRGFYHCVYTPSLISVTSESLN